MLKQWMVIGFVVLIIVACSEEKREQNRSTLDTQIELVILTPDIELPIETDDSRFPIQPATGTELESGKTLYELFCGNCHGYLGEGQQPDPFAPGIAPPHNDTGHTWHHPDQVNFQTVWLGRNIQGQMPGFSDKMTPDQVIQVLAYIKTWWSEESLTVQRERTLEAMSN